MRGCGQRRRLQPGLRAREPVGVADGPSFPERDPDAHGQPEPEPVTKPDADDAEPHTDHAVTDTHHAQPKPDAVTQPDRLSGGRHQRARRS